MLLVPPSDVSEAGEGRVEEVGGERTHHAAEEYLHKHALWIKKIFKKLTELICFQTTFLRQFPILSPKV
jgi:hypothetical protein